MPRGAVLVSAPDYKGTKTVLASATFVCLPDTVYPRGPKGKRTVGSW